MRMLGFLRGILALWEINAGADPNAEDCHRKTADHHHGALIGTWVHIPSCFLRKADQVDRQGIHATPPEEIWHRPGDVHEELVVQASGAQAADDE
jgi:hypothetical protein